jgi:hypothetical protein
VDGELMIYSGPKLFTVKHQRDSFEIEPFRGGYRVFAAEGHESATWATITAEQTRALRDWLVANVSG